MSAPADQADALPYGRLDRLLHRLAFASPGMQTALADAENRMFRDRIDLAHATRPVFVTSLPRAGTTVLLEALAQVPEFASATYRQMPFTLVPLLWSELTRRFRTSETLAERAHGDGIAVGFDSPEAFEEMLWMAFWPKHYGKRSIAPWAAEARNAEFESFFRRHMAKIVATGGPEAQRYLSKNNANIARLGLLARLFPDGAAVIPVRDPAAQIASLIRQHRRFCDLHAREPFSRRYMEGIGHFDFGASLKPIAFAGAPLDPGEADQPGFWLRYWIEAYESVLADAGEQAVFLDHDALSGEPEQHLPLLADALGLAAPDTLLRAAPRFRPSRPAAPLDAPPKLLARAAEIHDALCRRCLQPNVTPTRARNTG